MALRELLLSLGVEVDKSGVANADSALGKLKKAAVVAAAAFAGLKAVQGIGNLVDGVREMGDEIDKSSKQIGIGVEALQEWRFAAGLAGVAGNEMSNSLGRLQKNAFEAANGNKKMTEDFQKLGISVLDGAGNIKSADTLLTEFADGINGLDNETEKVALSLNLMGRTGKKLLPLFAEGSEGIAKMRQEAQELGGIMGQDLIDATVKLTDDQFRAQQAWQGIKNQIAGAIIPLFIKFANVSIKVGKALAGPVKMAIRTLKFALDVLWNILEFIISGWVQLVEVLGTVGTALLVLGAAFLLFGKKAVLTAIRVAAAWVIANLPFILMAALIALMLLALEDFIGFLQGKDSLIGRFIGGFRKWVRQMGGVSAAIGKIMETLFKKIFGLSDETARKIGGVFAAISEVIKFVFVGIPTFLGESLAAAYLWVQKFAQDFEDAMSAAVDAVIDKYNDLVDAVADFIQAAAEATGLDSFVDKGAQVDRKADMKAQRERAAASKEALRTRVKIFKQLEKEGFGTFTGPQAGQANIARNVGLSGIKDEAAAQARFEQLSQDINAPITVTVDARGATNPAKVGTATANAIDNSAAHRRAKQGVVTRRPVASGSE